MFTLVTFIQRFHLLNTKKSFKSKRPEFLIFSDAEKALDRRDTAAGKMSSVPRDSALQAAAGTCTGNLINHAIAFPQTFLSSQPLLIIIKIEERKKGRREQSTRVSRDAVIGSVGSRSLTGPCHLRLHAFLVKTKHTRRILHTDLKRQRLQIITLLSYLSSKPLRSLVNLSRLLSLSSKQILAHEASSCANATFGQPQMASLDQPIYVKAQLSCLCHGAVIMDAARVAYTSRFRAELLLVVRLPRYLQPIKLSKRWQMKLE